MSTILKNRRDQPLLKRRMVFFLCVLAFILAALGGPLWGPTPLHIQDALWGPSGAGSDSQVLFMLRIPRVFLALLAGAALSAAGAAFQTLLRNPLADPFTLGVAGGSSFGAVSVLLLFPAFAVVYPISLPAAAFLGALLSVGLTWGLSRWAPVSHGGLHPSSLLLSGLTVNFFFNALILVATYAVDFTRSASLMRWILGGLEGADWGILLPAFLPSVAAFLVLMALSPALVLFSGGEEMARSKGVSVEHTARWAFLAASLLTSSVTAFTGPIGFVGLMVPNLLRRYIGNDLKWLLPSSALLGAAFLTAADGAARTLFAPAELPVGALTALIGGPFFLFLLLRRGSAWRSE